MLKDRRILIEKELNLARGRAAKMYLDIVVNNLDSQDAEYQQLKDKIGELQFDLDMVNQLIDKGSE